MARQKLSAEERKRRNREYQKKRREKIYREEELKEEYLRAERQRYKKRVEGGKLKKINDLTAREQRRVRKAWKCRQEKSRKLKAKSSNQPETPPDSPVPQDVQVPAQSRQAIAGARKRKAERRRHHREMKALKNKLKKVTKARDKMKKRWAREKCKNKKTQESPGKKTEQLLQGSHLQNPSIKKTLLFHHALVHELNQNKTTDKKNLTLSGKILKKYRLIHKTRQFGVTYNTLRNRRLTDKRPAYIQTITKMIQDFYHNAARMTTDKQDTITRKKTKHQRMILPDTVLNLHKEFTQKEPTVKVSYASFCALRPFYVTAPRPSDRKTCQCQHHENAKLMLKILWENGVVKSSKLEDSFELVCCSQTSEACLLRSCARCLNKHTVPTPQQEQTNVEWQQWERVQDQTPDALHMNTRLVVHSGTVAELIQRYEDKLKIETTTHVCSVQNQAREYRSMIENCNDTTVIVHVDFSEAWKCKYSSEVQSCHFGQNLPMLNLHTGMYYVKGEKAAFCTISESKRQDAAAIWSHMEPILRDIRVKFPKVDTIHFWSDGPSKQYKNKKNFSLLCSVPSAQGFERTTWNFFPTSHGKGAPDGIGGTVKRTADSLVLRGKDIVDGTVFHEMVGRSLCSTKLYIITEADMQPYDALLSEALKAVPATRKIHQVIPTNQRDFEIRCRSLSCFCSEPEMCECFSPTTCQLMANTPRVEDDEDGPPPKKKKSPLAMLMEEMEQEQESEPQEMEEDETPTSRVPLPDGTIADLSADTVQCGDWLAVIYDNNWWLGKAVMVDAQHEDVQVEFFHPHGPNTRFSPKQVEGRRDMCFIPFEHILVKLVEPSAPGRASRTREIYSLSNEVMDYIEKKHIHHIQADKAE